MKLTSFKVSRMVTDDSLTDGWEVVCAKVAIYKEFLPDHVKKVRT
jgi:hypothetical protein